MKRTDLLSTGLAMFVAAAAFPGASAWAASAAPSLASGKTFASTAGQCAVHPDTGVSAPMVRAGLLNPRPRASAVVSLDGVPVATITAADPAADVWLAEGDNAVVVSLNRKASDRYAYNVIQGMCSLPAGNWLSADGTLEYGASAKSYATVTPGCALNPVTGQTQPYVNLFDNGTFVLNVSVNDVPLTQLSSRKAHTPVFLGAGTNLISVAEGSVSTDYFVRSGGDGTCTLP
jgi:hypothetical protein